MGADRAEMGSTMRSTGGRRVTRTWLKGLGEGEGDGLEGRKRNLGGGGER